MLGHLCAWGVHASKLSVSQVTTGVRWTWDSIRLWAVCTDCLVNGGHVERSAMVSRLVMALKKGEKRKDG